MRKEFDTPLAVKKLATGSGKSKKEQERAKKSKKEQVIEALPADVLAQFKAANYVKTRGLADLADAYFIAKCGEQLN